MSDDLIWLAWRNFPGRGSRLAVLMAIAEACNSHGSGHLHIAELAGISRLSPSTVFVSIKALRKERWIFTDRITGQGGTLIFQINGPKLSRSTRPDHHARDQRSPCSSGCATKSGRQSSEEFMLTDPL
jgi:hypothetical protein